MCGQNDDPTAYNNLMNLWDGKMYYDYEEEPYIKRELFEECNHNIDDPDSHWQPDPVCAICDRGSTEFPHNDIVNEDHMDEKHTLEPSGKFWRKNDCHGYRYVINSNWSNVEATCSCPCHWGVYYVNLYQLDQAYGGPEEGGWYYECGTMKGTMPFDTYKEAKEFADKLKEKYTDNRNRYSVAPKGEDYRVEISNYMGEDWPQHTPRYQ